MQSETIGPLRAHLAGGDDGNGNGGGAVVVLLHGFGAPGTDLVGLERQLSAPGTRFVFPEAPLPADVGMPPPFEGRAWWPIDMARLQVAAMTRSFESLTRHTPDGLDEARQTLLEFLDALDARLERSAEPLVLGGFSQGAMLTCDVALHSDREFSGLLLLSGSLIASAEWTSCLEARPQRKLRFLQSHGQLDPVLPFEIAEQLHRLLTQHGWPGRFVAFRGGHGISPEVLAETSRFLQELAQSVR